MQRVIFVTFLSLFLTFPAFGADDFTLNGDSYSKVVADFKKLTNEYKTTDMDIRERDQILTYLAIRADKLVTADSLADPSALAGDGYIYVHPYNCAPKETCKILDFLERLHNYLGLPDSSKAEPGLP